jgi:predicted  nucleic acid-binding Zn-ribbon protein
VENTNLTTEEVISKLDGLFTEKMQNVPTQEDVAGLKSELDSLKGLEEKSQEIEKAIAKFEGRIEAMSEKAITPAVEKLSVSQSLMKTYADNIEAIKGAVEKGGKINLDVKNNDYKRLHW